MKQKKTTQHEVDIEGLGVFYLGRKVDPDTGKPGTDAATAGPLLIDVQKIDNIDLRDVNNLNLLSATAMGIVGEASDGPDALQGPDGSDSTRHSSGSSHPMLSSAPAGAEVRDLIPPRLHITLQSCSRPSRHDLFADLDDSKLPSAPTQSSIRRPAMASDAASSDELSRPEHQPLCWVPPVKCCDTGHAA